MYVMFKTCPMILSSSCYHKHFFCVAQNNKHVLFFVAEKEEENDVRIAKVAFVLSFYNFTSLIWQHFLVKLCCLLMLPNLDKPCKLSIPCKDVQLLLQEHNSHHNASCVFFLCLKSIYLIVTFSNLQSHHYKGFERNKRSKRNSCQSFSLSPIVDDDIPHFYPIYHEIINMFSDQLVLHLMVHCHGHERKNWWRRNWI